MSGPPTPPRLLIPVLSGVNFVIGMGAFLVVGTIEPMAADLDVTAGQTGALMTTYALVYAVCSPLLVSLTGGIGRRRVLAAGLTIFGLAALASALAPTLGSLHAARAMAAVGAGVVTPVSAAVAAMLVPPERRARTLAQVFLGLTIAQAVGIPIGGWLAYTVGWRYAFTLVALIAIPALVLLWRIVPAGLSFRPVALSDLGRTLSDLPVMSAVLFTMSFMAGIFALYTYFAPLLTAQMGFGRDGVSLLLLIFGLGAIAGNRMGGVLADRFGPSRTLMALAVVQIVFLSMYSALPFPVWVLGAVTFIWSVFGWSFGAAQQVRLITLDPARAPVLLSLNAACIFGGAALGSAIGGVVITGIGIGALGWVAALCMAGALLHLVLSDRATAGRVARTP